MNEMKDKLALHLPIALRPDSLNTSNIFSVYDAVIRCNEVVCYEIAEAVEENFAPLDDSYYTYDDIANTLIMIYDKLMAYYDILEEINYRGYYLEDVIVYKTGLILLFEVEER